MPQDQDNAATNNKKNRRDLCAELIATVNRTTAMGANDGGYPACWVVEQNNKDVVNAYRAWLMAEVEEGGDSSTVVAGVDAYDRWRLYITSYAGAVVESESLGDAKHVSEPFAELASLVRAGAFTLLEDILVGRHANPAQELARVDRVATVAARPLRVDGGSSGGGGRVLKRIGRLLGSGYAALRAIEAGNLGEFKRLMDPGDDRGRMVYAIISFAQMRAITAAAAQQDLTVRREGGGSSTVADGVMGCYVKALRPCLLSFGASRLHGMAQLAIQDGDVDCCKVIVASDETTLNCFRWHSLAKLAVALPDGGDLHGWILSRLRDNVRTDSCHDMHLRDQGKEALRLDRFKAFEATVREHGPGYLRLFVTMYKCDDDLFMAQVNFLRVMIKKATPEEVNILRPTTIKKMAELAQANVDEGQMAELDDLWRHATLSPKFYALFAAKLEASCEPGRADGEPKRGVNCLVLYLLNSAWAFLKGEPPARGDQVVRFMTHTGIAAAAQEEICGKICALYSLRKDHYNPSMRILLKVLAQLPQDKNDLRSPVIETIIKLLKDYIRTGQDTACNDSSPLNAMMVLCNAGNSATADQKEAIGRIYSTFLQTYVGSDVGRMRLWVRTRYEDLQRKSGGNMGKVALLSEALDKVGDDSTSLRVIEVALEHLKEASGYAARNTRTLWERASRTTFSNLVIDAKYAVWGGRPRAADEMITRLGEMEEILRPLCEADHAVTSSSTAGEPEAASSGRPSA